MNGGYPATADIAALLASEGIEEIAENNTNFREEYLQFLWRLLMRNQFASALNVFCPTAATFNVVGGYYKFKGDIKTYTPGDAINPVDNDTTYIWMCDDNTIDSGIDGDGWPTTEHIKLAEIDVDEDGVITAVRDLRGQAFLNCPGESIYLLASKAAVDLNAAADTETVLYTVPTGKKAIIDKVVLRDPSDSAASAVITLGKSGGVCNEFLGDQTLSNLNATTKAVILQPVPNATPVGRAVLAAGESFASEITTAAGSACTVTMDVFGYLIDA